MNSRSSLFSTMIAFTTATRLSARIIGRRRPRRHRRPICRTVKVENSTSYRKNEFYMNKCRNSKRKEQDTTKKNAVVDSVAVDKETYEILGRLSVRSLTRFKCVCKNWRLIVEKDSFFKHLHLTHSRSRLNFFCVVQQPLEDDVRHGPSRKIFLVTADCISFDEGRGKNVVNIHNTREMDVPYFARFFGPLNGLIGFYDAKCYSGVRISNVSTQETTPWMESALVRKFKSKDKFRVRNISCQLGVDPVTKKHKVVCLCNIIYSNRNYGIFCEVLTIGDNKWRICEVPSIMIDEFRPIRGSVYANGSIYFSTVSLGKPDGRDGGEIVVFDVGSENIRSITLPDFDVDFSQLYTGITGYDVHILEMDGHLAFLCRIKRSTVKVWLYDDDDYKRNICWREFTIELPYSWDHRRQLIFHSVVGKKEIILKSYQNFPGTSGHKENHSYHLYDWTKKTYTQIEIIGIPSTIPYFFNESMCDKTFVESFLSVQ